MVVAMTDLIRQPDSVARDRALRLVRLVTIGGVGTAIGLTGIFSTMAAWTFSGKPVATLEAPPNVPTAAAPVQHAPPTPIVIEQVVHHPVRKGGAGAAAGPAPPSRGPVAMTPATLLPPPMPPCVSTPSHVC